MLKDTGIGLTAEQLLGSASAPGTGATMTMALPLAPMAQARAAELAA